jgi:hypothetical protein
VKGIKDEFPVRQPKDVDGITQVMEGDEDRFQYGRDGDQPPDDKLSVWFVPLPKHGGQEPNCWQRFG